MILTGAVRPTSFSIQLDVRPFVTEKKTMINHTTMAITRTEIIVIMETDSCRQRGVRYLAATESSNMQEIPLFLRLSLRDNLQNTIVFEGCFLLCFFKCNVLSCCWVVLLYFHTSRCVAFVFFCIIVEVADRTF